MEADSWANLRHSAVPEFILWVTVRVACLSSPQAGAGMFSRVHGGASIGHATHQLRFWSAGSGSTLRNRLVEMGATLVYAAVVAEPNAHQFAIEIARIAHDYKSEDLVALDLRGISYVTDYVVICTGTSDRQMRAVADLVIEYGKTIGESPFGKAGYENGVWILLDYVDVVFHTFAKAYREYYDLELLWGDAPRVEWARSVSA